MFEKILFPTDFSDVSLHTLYNCVPEFSNMGAKEVVITHIIEGAISIEKQEEKAKKRLEEIVSDLKDKGVNASYVVEFLGTVRKNPAEVICNRAYTQGVDLVVIPSKGMNILRESLIGSVARNVTRICEVPVLLLRHQWDKKKKEPKDIIDYEKTFDRPLIALDFSTCSERALDAVKKLEGIAKEAVLFHVVDYGRPEDVDDNIKESEYKLSKLAKAISFDTKNKVSGGEPSDSIMKAADNVQASIIVMSKSGGGMINELLVGSTTNSVIRRSSRPVMVVPCHEMKKTRTKEKERTRDIGWDEKYLPQVR